MRERSIREKFLDEFVLLAQNDWQLEYSIIGAVVFLLIAVYILSLLLSKKHKYQIRWGKDGQGKAFTTGGQITLLIYFLFLSAFSLSISLAPALMMPLTLVIFVGPVFIVIVDTVCRQAYGDPPGSEAESAKRPIMIPSSESVNFSYFVALVVATIALLLGAFLVMLGRRLGELAAFVAIAGVPLSISLYVYFLVIRAILRNVTELKVEGDDWLLHTLLRRKPFRYHRSQLKSAKLRPTRGMSIWVVQFEDGRVFYLNRHLFPADVEAMIETGAEIR